MVGAPTVLCPSQLIMFKIQTESPYYLPQPSAPTPFEGSVGRFSGDPTFDDCGNTKTCRVSWGLSISLSTDIQIVGAGLYSWYFNNYDQGCIEKRTCQDRVARVDPPSSNIAIYNLFTVGAAFMIESQQGATLSAKDNAMLISSSPWTSVLALWKKSIGMPTIFLAETM